MREKDLKSLLSLTAQLSAAEKEAAGVKAVIDAIEATLNLYEDQNNGVVKDLKQIIKLYRQGRFDKTAKNN